MPRNSDEDTLHSGGEHNDEGQQNQADGGESGEKRKHGGGGPIGFWSKELNDVRLDVFKNWELLASDPNFLTMHDIWLRKFNDSHYFVNFHSWGYVIILGHSVPC
jgi:hypothetical protein